jgi:hypothetical protein
MVRRKNFGIGFRMVMGREEALDIFRKWLSEESTLQVNCDLYIFAAAFRVRVREVLPRRINFFSDDGKSELVLPLPDDLRFGYAEPSAGSVEAMDAVSGLVVFFPSDDGDPDVLTFTEVLDL